eukprot:677893-Amphidinium_carterae.1
MTVLIGNFFIFRAFLSPNSIVGAQTPRSASWAFVGKRALAVRDVQGQRWCCCPLPSRSFAMAKFLVSEQWNSPSE